MAAILSRRTALAGLAAASAVSPASPIAAGRADDADRPTFSNTGPNAELYGAAEGYPVPNAAKARLQGNPWEPKDRVGAFTHLDEIYPTQQIKSAARPWMFKRAAAELPDS